MAFSNPIVAGEELIRPAIRSENWSDGSDGLPPAGWRITRDGDAFFNNVSLRGDAQGGSASFDTVTANTNLYYRGDELSVLLANLAGGCTAFGQYDGSLADPTTTTEAKILELQFTAQPGRQYAVRTTPMLIQGGTTNGGIVIRYTTNGSTPSVTSTIYLYDAETTGRFVKLDTVMIFAATTTVRLLLTVISFAGTTTISKGDAASPELSMWVTDEGDSASNTGISFPPGGGASPPTETFRQFEIVSNALRSYNGNGTYHSPSGDVYSWQGQNPSPGVGNMTGWSWFPYGSVGTPSLADMVSVPAGKLVYMDVYAFYPHWYNSSGGTAVYGSHNTASPPAIGASEPGGGAPSLLTQDFPGRGVGIWTTLFGSGIGTAILAGTFRGVVTGNHAGSTSFTYYGYASELRIRAGYYK